MRILIFSDLHGKIKNIEELIGKSCYDDYIFAGDIFGYFTCGSEVLDLLIKNNVKFILGNHDMYFLRELNPELFNERFPKFNELMIPGSAYNEKYGCLFDTIKNLNKSKLEYLFNSSLSENFSINNLRFSVCHGSPYNSFDQYIYPDYERINTIFEDFDFDVLILGHTHKPFYNFECGGRRVIINPGSCTLPRDGYDPSFAVFDTTTFNVQISYLQQQVLFFRETKSKLIEK
jgi:putative phosphoesterase